MCILEIFEKVFSRRRHTKIISNVVSINFANISGLSSLSPVACRHLASWKWTKSSRKCSPHGWECRWRCMRWDCRHTEWPWWWESMSTAALWWRHYVDERRHYPFGSLGSWSNPLGRREAYTWLTNNCTCGWGGRTNLDEYNFAQKHNNSFNHTQLSSMMMLSLRAYCGNFSSLILPAFGLEHFCLFRNYN